MKKIHLTIILIINFIGVLLLIFFHIHRLKKQKQLPTYDFMYINDYLHIDDTSAKTYYLYKNDILAKKYDPFLENK